MRSCLKLVVLLALTMSWPAMAASVDFPPTPAGRQAAAWVDVFNQGDRKALDAVQSSLPAGKAPRDLPSPVSTGGFELVQVEQSSDTAFTGVLKQRDWDRFARISLQVQPTAGHAITSLDIRNRIPRPAAIAPPSRLPTTELVALLQSKLAKLPSEAFSGAVLLAKDGRVQFAGAYGEADRATHIHNTLETRFRIGSMNKMVTAVAVMQLVQAGKVRLDAPIADYVSDYPNPAFATRVTVRQLLTHTGGGGDIFGPEFDANRGALREPRDYVALFGKREAEFPPGSRWSYSNYGFVLLGRLVERVSGQPYDDYVRDHIFRPAGMTRSGALPESDLVPGRSVGYTTGPDGLRPNSDTLPYRGTPAGGGYSTVGDILRFAEALTDNRLLDRQHTALITTGQVTIGPGNLDTGGFQDVTFDGVRWVGHPGGAPGMNGDLRIFPDSGWTLVVLANLDPPAAEQLANFINARLPVK